MNNNLLKAINATLKAGNEILKIYDRDFDVELKEDQTPLTEADKKANEIIVNRLKGTAIPIISEEIENMDYAERKDWDYCWSVDPLDGTKEFVKKNGEFTVNIALIKAGKPVMGVVYIPVRHKLYFATETEGSFVTEMEPSEQDIGEEDLFQNARQLKGLQPPETYTIVTSRSHKSGETEKFIEKCRKKHGDIRLVSCGSSIKLCWVAERKAHIYPRLAPTMEWDTAAAHAVAKFAGCEVVRAEDGGELQYNKADLMNPYFIVKTAAEQGN